MIPSFSTKTLSCMAEVELTQLDEEGRETADLRAILERTRQPGQERAALEEFWRLAPCAQPVEDYKYDEPTSWDEIETTCCQMYSEPQPLPDREELLRRIQGAWLGRCAGCVLGKPVEGWKRTDIQALLEYAGEYPLNDYFPALPEYDEPQSFPYIGHDNDSLRQNIRYSARDDDTDYTILGLHMVKTYGGKLTSANVGTEWMLRLPYRKTYTAEQVAYRNLVLEIPADKTAIFMNPYREWIGAQIRCDAFGYVSPGWAWQAAKLAYQDAALTHVKNGIYGEIFFAAMIAESLVSSYGNIHGVIERALRVVPANSRFAEMVRTVTDWCNADDAWETTRDRVEAEYGHYNWVHTINNAALVLLGILHSKGDFGRAISIAVMGGWDTDCNGATAGSVMGTLVGADGIDAKWTGRFNDTLYSAIDGYNVNSISDLATQTVDLAIQLRQ